MSTFITIVMYLMFGVDQVDEALFVLALTLLVDCFTFGIGVLVGYFWPKKEIRSAGKG